MSVTLKDVAKQAGVSAVTVSKVVNGNDQHISQETRAKIQKIVKQMGYVPNAVAKGLKVETDKYARLFASRYFQLLFPGCCPRNRGHR